MSGDTDFWPKLVLAVLATWRVTHLLAREDGPVDLIARARAALGDGVWGRMFDCFHCLSLWVAAPISLWVAAKPLDALLVWLAVSGAACLVERIGRPDVVLQPLLEPNQGEDDGMLRTKAEPAARRDASYPAPGVAGAGSATPGPSPGLDG